MLKIAIFALILIGITVFLLFPHGEIGRSNTPILSSLSPKVTTQIVPKSSEIPTATNIPYLTDDFVKRQFDPKSKFIVGGGRDATPSADYPNELITVANDQLQNMRCSESFDPDGNQYFYHDSKQNNQRFAVAPDKTFQEVLNKINSDNEAGKYTLRFFSYCLTEDNRMLIHYYRIGKDMSQEKDPLDVFLLSENDKIKRVAINIGPAMYFSCNEPLQFTTNNELYFKCGGGDTTSFYSIYKIDFNNQKASISIDCYQTEGDYYAEPNPPLICK